MELIKLIKQAAIEAVESTRPADIIEGVVQSTTPLKVKTDQSQILEETFLVNYQGLTFKKNDQLVLIKKPGGQKFYVIGRYK